MEDAVSPETKVAVHVDGRTLTLTNLAKILYPQTGFTKAEVLDYYQRVAAVLLPHIAGRPLTLKRYPEGVDGEAFFQKHVTAHRPDWIRTARVTSESSRARARPPARRPRSACLRPSRGRPRQYRGLLPGRLRPASAARGRRARPA